MSLTMPKKNKIYYLKTDTDKNNPIKVVWAINSYVCIIDNTEEDFCVSLDLFWERVENISYDPPRYKCINPLTRKQKWALKWSRMCSFVTKAASNVGRLTREDYILMVAVFASAATTIIGGAYLISMLAHWLQK